MPDDLPTLPPSSQLPAGLPEGNPLTTLLGEAAFKVFKTLDPEAYLEMLARTEPKLFQKYVALVFADSRTRMMLAAGGADQRNQTIVNVMNAIPRSPLDELPEGFRTK